MSYAEERVISSRKWLLWLVVPLAVAGISFAAWELGFAHGGAEVTNSREQRLPQSQETEAGTEAPVTPRQPAETDFSSYSAAIHEGTLVDPGEENAWPNMEEDLSKGINFGGHFTYVVFPCGTGCAASWFIDRRTGQMVRAPEGGSAEEAVSIETRPTSNLVKVVWATSDHDGSGDLRPSCSQQSFVWNGERFRDLSGQVRVNCPAEIAQ